MCSGSETGSYLRRIDFVCHTTLGLRVIKKGLGWACVFDDSAEVCGEEEEGDGHGHQKLLSPYE